MSTLMIMIPMKLNLHIPIEFEISKNKGYIIVNFKVHIFKYLWKIVLIKNYNQLKFPLILVKETSTSLHYIFHHINPQIGLEITMDEYCEIMITFNNLDKERMDHIVLVWEYYDVALRLSVSKMEQWLNAIVEYTQIFFTYEHCLVIFDKPHHYSHASIIPIHQVQEDSIEIFPIIFSDA